MTENGDESLVWKWTNDTLDTTTFATSATGTAITNLFDESDPNKSSDAPGSVTWMSRSDWTGTIPTAPAQLTANETLAASLAFTQYDGSEANSVEMPTLGAKNGLTLASMIGKDFDDPEWDTLLDQLTYSEMVNTITLGFHNTAAAASIGKTATKDENGPQGLTAALTGGASAMCYTSEDVMAATFNVDLINEVGRCIGEDCLAMGYSGLYGPGINMHRTAYSGRNFEYYSEDGVLSGAMAANAIAGAQEHGVYAYMKHFALNDQEGNRNCMAATWSNEQAIREIYLKPFEMSVKDADCHAVMSSFNYIGNRWAGGCSELLQNVLRGEWGFLGFVETDYFGVYGYMTADQAVRNGGDLMLCTTGNDYNKVTVLTNSSKQAMRTAAKNILYTVVNSRAYEAENLNPGMAKWKIVLIGADVVAALLIVGLEYTAIKNYKKRKEEEEEV